MDFYSTPGFAKFSEGGEGSVDPVGSLCVCVCVCACVCGLGREAEVFFCERVEGEGGSAFCVCVCARACVSG